MSFLSEIVLDAMQFSAQKHQGQERKGPGLIPYISHPAAVGLILAKAGYDDAVVCAGILHDTIEDTDTTFEEIEQRFGERIARLVLDVTEDNTMKDFLQRKQAYRDHLEKASSEALAISAADLLANRTSCLLLLKQGFNAWSIFSGNKKESVCERDTKRFEIIAARLRSPIVDELKKVLEESETYGE